MKSIEKKRFASSAFMRRMSAVLVTLAMLAGASFATHVRAQAVSADAWKGIVAAAHKEGRFVFYSSLVPPVYNRLKADFEKAYPGITIEMARLVGSQLMTRLELDRQSNADGADIHLSTEIGWFDTNAKEGNLRPVVGPATPSWPQAFLIGGAVPILAMEPAVIAYNPNVWKTPINSYQDLLAPELKGKLGALDVVATIMVAFYDWIEKTQGPDYLAKLAAQQPRLYTSTVTGAQSAISGEFPVVMYLNTGVAVPLIQQGAPLRIVFPKPTFGNQYAAAVLKSARRPNAALVFMDYMMSVRGQSIWHGGGDSASVLPNIPGSLDAKSINPYNPAAYPPEVVNAFRTRWNALIKK